MPIDNLLWYARIGVFQSAKFKSFNKVYTDRSVKLGNQECVCVCVCVCVYVYMCMSMCVLYMHVYMCVGLSVCVYGRVCICI